MICFSSSLPVTKTILLLRAFIDSSAQQMGCWHSKVGAVTDLDHVNTLSKDARDWLGHESAEDEDEAASLRDDSVIVQSYKKTV